MLGRIATAIALPILVTATTHGVDSAAHPTDSGVHFELIRSDPGDEAMIDEVPSQVRLWFSEEPQAHGARVRLMGPDEALVSMGDVERDAEDEKLVTAAIIGEIQSGSYTVIWRAMGRDGHVVSGEFTFSYHAAMNTR